MSRLDDAISNVAYILDSLTALRNIYRKGRHCNDCGTEIADMTLIRVSR